MKRFVLFAVLAAAAQALPLLQAPAQAQEPASANGVPTARTGSPADLVDAKRADREKVAHAEKKQELEKEKVSKIVAVIVTFCEILDGRDSKMKQLDNIVNGVRDFSGLKTEKQMELEAASEYEAERLGKSIVEEEKRLNAAKELETRKGFRRLEEILDEILPDPLPKPNQPAQGGSPQYLKRIPGAGAPSPKQKPKSPPNFLVPHISSKPSGKPTYAGLSAPRVPFPTGTANPFSNPALKPGSSGGSGQPVFVPRVTFDDSASKRPAPKGVSMRVGIDRGTVQRLQAPPSLIAAIRAEN